MTLHRIKRIWITHCFCLLIAGFWSAFTHSANAGHPSIAIDHLEGPKIYFKNSPESQAVPPVDTQLFDLNPLGKLQAPEGKSSPYFLFSGKPCADCQLEKGIFVVRPFGGQPTAYAYPGRTLDPRTKRVLMESRAFFGQCVPGRGDVLVYFQLERVDRRSQLQSSVLIAEAQEDHLEDFLIERRPPSLKRTLQLVKKRVCSEIPGETRLSTSKMIDLHPATKS